MEKCGGNLSTLLSERSQSVKATYCTFQVHEILEKEKLQGKSLSVFARCWGGKEEMSRQHTEDF
jgi:hypothetical protein